MKVFFLGKYNPGEILTGPEKVAKRVFNEFAKKHDAVFIEYFFDGRRHGFLKKLFGKQIIEKDSTRLILRLGLFSLFFFLMKEKPTTIHIITFERFTVVSFIYKFFHKTNIICGFQGIAAHENLYYKSVPRFYKFKDSLCEKIIVRHSDILVFLSDRSVDIAKRYYNFPNADVRIFPNGADQLFSEFGSRKKFSPSDKLSIVFTGNIERKEKGYKFLESALNKSDLQFDLYLISNERKFQQVNFHEVPLMNTRELAEFLLDKDIFISSSEYEPFSMAAAEAMSEGLICVATRETGLSRYITDGENGFLFNFGDDRKLIEILGMLAAKRDIFSQISERAKEVYGKISWEVVTRMYVNLYK